MTPKRLLTTALLSLSFFTIGLSEAKAAQVKSLPDIQEPQLVARKFKKFSRRGRGFRGRRFRRSSSFRHKKFKVIKKHDFDHDKKFHDKKFHDKKFFFK